MHITSDCKQMLCGSLYLLRLQIWIIMMQMYKLIVIALRQIRVNYVQKCSFGFLEKQEQTPLRSRVFAIF